VKAKTAVIDPPWPYNITSKDKKLSGYSDAKYQPLGAKALKELPIGDVVDGYLFLWTVGPFIPLASELITAWGFDYITAMTWQKLTKNGKLAYGAGYWFRGSSEYVLVGKKPGNLSVRTHERNAFQTIAEPHSKKPESFQDMIEKHFPGPYLEVFARRQREGWTCLGDECPGDGKDIRESLDDLRLTTP